MYKALLLFCALLLIKAMWWMDGQVGKMCTVFDSHESNLWLWSPCRATGGGSTAASSSSGAPQVSSGTAPTANASPAGNLGTSQGSGPSPAPSQPSNIFSECWERGCIICEGSRVYIWELHSYNAILQSENEKRNLLGSFVFFFYDGCCLRGRKVNIRYYIGK